MGILDQDQRTECDSNPAQAKGKTTLHLLLDKHILQQLAVFEELKPILLRLALDQVSLEFICTIYI